ncbi:hypothetical protein PoB_001584100 [Plakobranchus ocellatus]|uniref:Uncharacterized protein n=1 Tax=Plakobranchus ocellatus TaxID=259542 RepID=A0AAV3Z431_9GAST|nr:hypothetical protein PoB_001584100 [Plakobranchus ocellatus]
MLHHILASVPPTGKAPKDAQVLTREKIPLQFTGKVTLPQPPSTARSDCRKSGRRVNKVFLESPAKADTRNSSSGALPEEGHIKHQSVQYVLLAPQSSRFFMLHLIQIDVDDTFFFLSFYLLEGHIN